MAFRAIIPLCLFMMFVLVFIVREKIPRVDEISFGIFFALLGMGIFNIGIELGLTKLGNQIGSKLPSSFTTIQLPEQPGLRLRRRHIPIYLNIDLRQGHVQTYMMGGIGS